MNRLFFKSRFNLFDLIFIMLGVNISLDIGTNNFLGGFIFLMIWCIVGAAISSTGEHWPEIKEMWNDIRGKSNGR